MIIGRIKL